jgi:hypothetical protein
VSCANFHVTFTKSLFTALLPAAESGRVVDEARPTRSTGKLSIQNAQRSCKEFLRCAPDGIMLLGLTRIILLA